MDLEDEWANFLTNTPPCLDIDHLNTLDDDIIPDSTELYISTNTIISYLNREFNITELFWKLAVIPYYEQKEGIIKKQIKLSCNSAEEVNELDANIKLSGRYGYRSTIKHIENERGNIKYKNISKITIGMSKKDIISYRLKQKGAFYNCIVIILRIELNDTFKEFHVKIFNTGKIEIPGIQHKEHLPFVIQHLLYQLQLHYPDVNYNASNEETVLINSNFNCGYYINRDHLYNKLRYEKNISAVYDPCSYPGIQCKIYYTHDGQIVSTPIPNNIVSFMIFRTGSILIVGKCSIQIIYKIYDYIVELLKELYTHIVDKKNNYTKPDILKKRIKKTIYIK
jgi:TATA-box binding protein (TBP) (component of TFIID and TFIIIB)